MGTQVAVITSRLTPIAPHMSQSLTSRNGAFQRSELLNGIVPNIEKLAPRLLFLFAPDLGQRANEEAGDELQR